MMKWHTRLSTAGVILLSLTALTAKENLSTEPVVVENETVNQQASVTIDGKKLDYTVSTGELSLTNDQGEAEAHIFHVSYTKNDVKDVSTRPVLFAFNGGPGSSAVWLHIGALGPRIIPTSTDGTHALSPPVTVVENPQSILDVADLVFIDPVSTGLSRPEDKDKAKKFHGVNGDLDSISDFIRRWVTEHQRWSSPKFILGESYGAVRAAGLSSKLQQRYGMQLNGVVLLSGLLDFRSVSPSQGNDLSYISFLTSMTAVAHHHGVISGDLEKLLAEAKTFADSDYRIALHMGHTQSLDKKKAIAEKLSQYTGMDSQWILDNHLRISPTKFRAELLRSKNKVIGRFDGRVAWDAIDSSSSYPSYDPSYSVVHGPISTAMLDYLGRDLGWKDARVYEILTGAVHPWNWNATNSYVNLSDSLATALTHNPKLRILVQCGDTDLATPAGGIRYSLDHLLLPQSLRNNISVERYDAGHMFYLNQPDLEKMRHDLVKFITHQ